MGISIPAAPQLFNNDRDGSILKSHVCGKAKRDKETILVREGKKRI